jgi:outer membrane biosynthesis protein TonB
MSWIRGFGLVGLASLLIATAQAQDTSNIGPGDEGVHWIERPSADAFDRFYPAAARSQNVDGRVILLCHVHLDTSVSCDIESEAPVGWRFSEAALAISQSFRLTPFIRNGRPTEGGRVRVPISFHIDEPNRAVHGDLTAEQAAILDQFPRSVVPRWDRAPNLEAVMAAYPADALRNHTRGRAVLSCRVNPDNTLACELQSETPAGAGFDEAALTLVQQFHASEFNSEFREHHGDGRFMLPLNFGAPPTQEPVSPFYAGADPIPVPPPPEELVRAIYPSAARRAGIPGTVTLLCAIHDDAPMTCTIRTETPTGHGFGAAALGWLRGFAISAQAFGLLDGDQVLVTVPFRPQT